MVLLVDLPHELLAAILATHSPSVLSLYKCGSKALSLKLFHRGVTQIHLQNSKRFYLPYFPVIIPSFRYLRSLSIIRCGSYIANYSSTTEALKQLPSSLEELVLDFANSGPTFCSILRPVSTSAATLTPANDDTFETIHGFDDPSDFPFLRKLQLADLGFEPSVVSRLGQLTSLTDLHAHIGLHDSEEHDLSTLNSYLPKGLLRLTVELPWQPPIASLSNLPPVLEYLKIVTKEEYRAHIEPGIAASLPRTLRTFKSDCFAFLFSVAMMNALPPLITEIYYEMISGDIPDVLKAIPSEVTVLRTRYPSNQHFALSHIPHLPQGLKVLTAAFMNIDNGDNLFSFPPKITSLKLEIHDPSNSLTSMLPPHLTKLILVQGPYLTREDIGLLPRTLRRLQIWLAAETSEMPTPVVWPPYLEELLIYDSIGARADPDNPGAINTQIYERCFEFPASLSKLSLLGSDAISSSVLLLLPDRLRHLEIFDVYYDHAWNPRSPILRERARHLLNVGLELGFVDDSEKASLLAPTTDYEVTLFDLLPRTLTCFASNGDLMTQLPPFMWKRLPKFLQKCSMFGPPWVNPDFLLHMPMKHLVSLSVRLNAIGLEHMKKLPRGLNSSSSIHAFQASGNNSEEFSRVYNAAPIELDQQSLSIFTNGTGWTKILRGREKALQTSNVPSLARLTSPLTDSEQRPVGEKQPKAQRGRKRGK